MPTNPTTPLSRVLAAIDAGTFERVLTWLHGGAEKLDGRPLGGFSRGGMGVYSRTTGETVTSEVGDRNYTENERRAIGECLAWLLSQTPDLLAAVVALRAELATVLGTEIADERARQDAQWGSAHDDMHVTSDWVEFICKHANRAVTTTSGHVSPEHFEKQMIRVAALAVAAVQSMRRQSAMATPRKEPQ